MEKPRTIKISESKIREAVISGVKKHLDEISYATVNNAYYKTYDIDFNAVREALKTIQIALNEFDSDSFHVRNRAISHFIATGKEPVDSAYEKFSRYIDEMRSFFERKANQQQAFYDAIPEKAREADEEILNRLHNAGYEGDDAEAIINSMDYDQLEDFENSLPREMLGYFRQNF